MACHRSAIKRLIVLSLFQYKYWREYLLCGRLQWEQMGVESLNFPTLCVRPRVKWSRGWQVSIYIKEYRTLLSPWRPLIGSSRDFTREHGSSWAWKWSRSDVDCGFLIKVTRRNSVTLIWNWSCTEVCCWHVALIVTGWLPWLSFTTQTSHTLMIPRVHACRYFI